MFTGFFKTIFIFHRMTIYYLKSFDKRNQIHTLKKQFSIEVLTILGFKIKTLGEPVLKNKLILVGNHISYLDILVVLVAHPESVFLAKSEVSQWALIGSVAKKIGTLFVVRNSKNSRVKIKEQIVKILNSTTTSLQIAGFPSGTTTLSEEKPWKKGLFEIAQSTQIHIQPFRISYSHPRECAYIDDDQLFSCLINLFQLKNKEIYFEWGKSFQVTDLLKQIESTRIWTQKIDLPQFESFKPGQKSDRDKMSYVKSEQLALEQLQS